jgi:glutamate dehydrogenase/leucine dehydrogenase
MRQAYAGVRQVAREFNVDSRTAAQIVAIRRVGEAAVMRKGLTRPITF